MASSIEERVLATKTTYRVVWRAARKKQFSPTFDTRQEAEDYQVLLEAERIRSGQMRNLTKRETPFRQVAEEWFRLWAPGREPSTASSKRSVLTAQLIPEFGDRGIGEITRKDVQIWVNECDAEPSSVSKYYFTFGQIMKHALDEDLLPRGLPSGAGTVKLPKGKRRQIFLDHDQVDHLLKVTREKFPAHYPLIHLECHTGLRVGEVMGLRRSAFNARRATLFVEGTKSDASLRTIALDWCCVKVLTDQLAGHDYDLIFPASGGRFNDVSNWRKRVWYKVRDAAGFKAMDLHFHDLRHTHASHLLEAGWEPTAVAQRLGHTPRVLMEVYGHVIHPERQAQLLKTKGMRG